MDDSSNLVTLTCPNHYEELTSGLLNFIATKHRTDYSVQFPAGLVHAHQLILDVFLPPENPDGKALCQNRDILETLIQFMYTGSVTVNTDKLELLRTIGLRLGFKLLLDAVVAATGSCDDQSTVSVGESGQETVVDSAVSTSNIRTRRKGNPVKMGHPGSSMVTKLGIQDGAQDLDLAVDHPEETPSSNESDQPDANDDEPTPEQSDEEYTPKLSKTTPTRRTRQRPASSSTKKTEVAEPAAGNCDRLRQYNRSHPVIRCQQKPCKFRSRSENTYQVHLATQHASGRELFPCPTCARPFIDAALLERHRRFKHRKPKGDEVDCTEFHQCPHCVYKTRYKVRYEVHLKRRHGESNAEIFRCDKCSIVFLQNDAFERHKRSHKQYKCGHCDFETTKKWTYSHHLFSVHRVNEKGQSVDKIPCPHCDYKGKNNCVLRYHIATRHTATFDKPYKCSYAPECHYASGRKGDRDKHVKIAHLGQKNYMCEFCSFRTITPFALELHRRTHTLERPFKCTFCEKKFSGKDSLRKHTKLHTSNEKNHLCHLCTFACNRRDNLRTHLKGVHKNQIANLDPGAI